MRRILTGDNATGTHHLGHLIGSINNRVKHQYEYETFIIIADMHALAYPKYINPDYDFKDAVYEILLGNLSAGLDPEKVYLFNESSVPEIFQISTIFTNFVSHSRALRAPTIKDEIKEKNLGDNYSLGFINFPTLMSADILSVQADLVPVGEDQVPMIELARDIVEKLNSIYKCNLKFPDVELSSFPRLVGTDGSVKMTKSIGNAIFLTDSTDVVREKIMKMYTDPNRLRATDPGKVEGNPVFVYHDAFNKNIEEVEDLKNRYREGKVGDVEVKEKLFFAIEEVLEPIRNRRKEFEDIDLLNNILKKGNEKVRQEASKTLKKLKEDLKLLTI
jgi:tryptophanyl-tRNA synthetase